MNDSLHRRLDPLLTAADYLGTLLFAMEGALAGAVAGMDIFGMFVLSFITAAGGGIVRDLLLGATPPASVRNWHYVAIAFCGGLSAFFFHRIMAETFHGMLIVSLDAAGLALFAIAGTTKALEFDMHPLMAILLGVITGCGGGTIRDILLNQVPGILRADVYASAALVGAAVMVVGLKLKMPAWAAGVAGGVCCFGLRIVSVWLHWNLPHAF